MVRSAQGDLVVRLGAGDLSLYDGDVDHSLRGHRHTDCDDPGGHMKFWHVTSKQKSSHLESFCLCSDVQ